MTKFRRSIISVYRHPLKSGIFLVLVFVLSLLMVGAIIVHSAISNAEQSLRSRMPALTMVEYDWDLDVAEQFFQDTGEWPTEDSLTRDILYEIGSFPQVRIFDYSINISISGVFAYELVPWEDGDWIDYFRYTEGFGTAVTISGVGRTSFLEARSDFMELVDGRNFLESELGEVSEVHPVLLSFDFAQANNLTIGSTFEVKAVDLEYLNQLIIEGDTFRVDDDSMFKSMFPFQVIGIFEPEFHHIRADQDEWIFFMERSATNHRMYVPGYVAELMLDRVIGSSQVAMYGDQIFRNMFLLDDSLLFDEFSQMVEGLPGNWRAIDFSQGFDDISVAMTNLQEVADIILILGVGATLLIVSLTVLLFLKDRKYEIGVYLALGEKKRRIISQIVTEVFSLTFVAMTLALFVGRIVAHEMSHDMLRHELENSTSADMPVQAHLLEHLGYRFELSHEEMLEMYVIELNEEVVVLYYVLGMSVILISAGLPIVKTVNMNPKKVLL